jgi:hypothetical protein
MEKRPNNESKLSTNIGSGSFFDQFFLFIHVSRLATSRAKRNSNHDHRFGAVLLRLALPVRLLHGFDYASPKSLQGALPKPSR